MESQWNKYLKEDKMDEGLLKALRFKLDGKTESPHLPRKAFYISILHKLLMGSTFLLLDRIGHFMDIH